MGQNFESKKNLGKAVVRLVVTDWAYRFSYTPPSPRPKGPSPAETKWAVHLPTKRRQKKRATRRGKRA